MWYSLDWILYSEGYYEEKGWLNTARFSQLVRRKVTLTKGKNLRAFYCGFLYDRYKTSSPRTYQCHIGVVPSNGKLSFPICIIFFFNGEFADRKISISLFLFLCSFFKSVFLLLLFYYFIFIFIDNKAFPLSSSFLFTVVDC